MMKIVYVSYSSDFRLKKELCGLLKKIPRVSFVFPDESQNSKNIIKGSVLLIAEISKSSSGVGIEIGWADSFGVPVIFIHKKGSKNSSSLRLISSKFIEYNKIEDIQAPLESYLRGKP